MMTEEQAHANAEALAIALGITFYVVRSSEGEFSVVQMSSDENEIIATLEPPKEHDHKLE